MRTRVIGWRSVLTGALLSVALITACSSGSPNSSASSSASAPDAMPQATGQPNGSETTPAPDTTTPADTTSLAPVASPYTSSGWLAAENALEGTDAWRIDLDVAPAKRGDRDGAIEGYANTTSVRPGETLDLYVATAADSWHF